MRKIIYISNVNLDGSLLRGVINKISGQSKAFRSEGYELDTLFPGLDSKIVLKKQSGEVKYFEGGSKYLTGQTYILKLVSYLRESYQGSMDFTDCQQEIFGQGYDAVYLRFFMPGTRLVSFLKNLKIANPNLIILLEYPTLNIEELFRNTLSRRVSFLMNKKKIDKVNKLADYIITLTDDQILFGKPALLMPNGIDLDNIEPIQSPVYKSKLVLVGVASDINYYHGFDRLVRGLAKYKSENHSVEILLRLIGNPLSKSLTELKALTEKNGTKDWVSFELPMSQDQLIDVYKNAHLGIGTLALHRIGLIKNYSLKHREYAAFGLPFIMSIGDSHFEDTPFVMTFESNEDPLPVNEIVQFYENLREQKPHYPQEFRRSIENKLKWNVQMKDVFRVIDSGK